MLTISARYHNLPNCVFSLLILGKYYVVHTLPFSGRGLLSVRVLIKMKGWKHEAEKENIKVDWFLLGCSVYALYHYQAYDQLGWRIMVMAYWYESVNKKTHRFFIPWYEKWIIFGAKWFTTARYDSNFEVCWPVDSILTSFSNAFWVKRSTSFSVSPSSKRK